MSSQQRREPGPHFNILAAGPVKIGGALGGRCALKRQVENFAFAIGLSRHMCTLRLPYFSQTHFRGNSCQENPLPPIRACRHWKKPITLARSKRFGLGFLSIGDESHVAIGTLAKTETKTVKAGMIQFG